MSIVDRYAGAIRSSNLGSKPDTTYSDSDVLGAAGLAGKRSPLAMALLRLFCGDGRSAPELVAIMGSMAQSFADDNRIKIRSAQSLDMARAVLAWHRDGRCKACGGHGFDLTPGDRDSRRALTDRPCQACKGSGKIPFDSQFSMERLVVARWLLDRVEHEQSRAGPAAMASLVLRLDF